MANILSEHESERDSGVVMGARDAEAKNNQHPQPEQEGNLLCGEVRIAEAFYVRDVSLPAKEENSQEHRAKTFKE